MSYYVLDPSGHHPSCFNRSHFTVTRSSSWGQTKVKTDWQNGFRVLCFVWFPHSFLSEVEKDKHLDILLCVFECLTTSGVCTYKAIFQRDFFFWVLYCSNISISSLTHWKTAWWLSGEHCHVTARSLVWTPAEPGDLSVWSLHVLAMSVSW